MQALETHDVFNQFDELTGINLLQADAALQEVLQRQQAQGFVPALNRFAQQLGKKHRWEQAELANRHTPELQRFDARGRVLDAVEALLRRVPAFLLDCTISEEAVDCLYEALYPATVAETVRLRACL